MISFLSYSITATGLLLLLILFYQVRNATTEVRLKTFRQQKAGLADLLNYAAMVDEGILVGKNGSLMASWLYRGDDQASSTEEAREMVSFRLNQALASFGTGWMLHVDAIRRPAPNYSDKNHSHFPDRLSKAIDEERRHFFEELGVLYEGLFVVTLTWFPPRLVQQRFVGLMFDDQHQHTSKKSRTLALIDEFKRECQHFESRLGTALTLERLRSHPVLQEDGNVLLQDDLLRYVHYCVTGLNHPIILPYTPIYLDALLGNQEMWSGVTPKVGRQFIQCVAIEGFPLEATPGMLNALSELPVTYRWNSRFIFLDSHEAVAHLTKFRKKWNQKIRGFFSQLFNTQSGVIDEDALLMTKDAETAIAETNSGLVKQGYYTAVVVLMDEHRDRLEQSARVIEKKIHALGFAARVETINTQEAYLGSLPGHGVENVRRPLLNTFNLADLLPTSSIWTGENKAPSPLLPPLSPPLMHCLTSGNTPFRLNLHVRDLGHTIIFGPTRAGKSTLLAFLALSWRRYPGARIYAFDKGLSMYPTCKAVGGEHYHLASKKRKLAFAPLQFLETQADRAWAMEWIDAILALNGVHTTPKQRNEIGYAILSMHQSQSKTMSEFLILIQDEPIREALKQYSIDGLMGDLLDAEQDGLDLADFMTFEIEDLMNLGEKFLLPVLLYIFRRIEMSLDGRPTMILLDEAWVMLAHIVFRGKINEWLNSMAKKNCIVVLSTQHVSQAAQSGILDVIVASTATKIFLPNLYARNEDTAALYTRMGLNKTEINIIAHARPKHDYYVVSEKGKRLCELALGPLALAFVGATDLDSIATIQTLEARFGAAWVSEWLAMNGLNHYLDGVAA